MGYIMKPPNRTFASYRMQTCGARGTDKLEFGGESPLTMRYGLRVDIPHPLGPSTGTA